MLKNTLKLIYSVWLGVSFFLILPLIVIAYFIGNLFVSKERSYWYLLRVIHYGFGVWAFLCGIRFKAIDREKVPNDRAYVFVCNHQSNLDAMLWGYVNNYLVKGLAKKELMKVPILGYLFRKTCVIVDRSSKESRGKSLENLREIKKNNVSIFFFPEGTRNKTDKPLQPFYDGAFRVAIELQEPIAPLVICNSSYLMPNGTILFRPGVAKCVFLNPIPTKGLTVEDMPALKQKVFDIMKKAIVKHDIRFSGKS